MNATKRCRGLVRDFGGGEARLCGEPSTVEREGAWYCGDHDPAASRENKVKRHEEFLLRRENEKKKRVDTAHKRMAGCVGRLVDALSDLLPAAGLTGASTGKARAAIAAAQDAINELRRAEN